MPLPSLRRPLVLLAVGLAAVAAALGVAHATGLLLDDSARPALVGDVVERYRSSPHTAAGLSGVYLYATRGSESIDALGGALHRYPARTAITVRPVSCGLSLRWQPLAERVTTWTLCMRGSMIELRAIDQLHRFFGQDDHTRYACTGGVIVPGTAGGAASAFGCRAGAGREAISVRRLGVAAVTVAGRRLEAAHVKTVARVGGENRGSETIEWWLDGRGLPLRIVLRSRTSRHVFLGTVNYREDAELQLLSTTPRR
jgi:hypothetical protein